ncbi:MAG: hypothetical protein SVJ22_00805 [Halobacteriota archaeon]|nr:hypothetical protein [Halobacteriota archaeon]
MHFSSRTKVILLGLLIFLNLIIRYPSVPHEIGVDSFAMHLSANSISDFGYAKWWIHPASILGSYPYSTSPSAVPFFLSGLSQLTGIDMESAILLYSIFLGLFSICVAYLMAGAIYDDDRFKFFVAFIFSTSQGIVTFTTWTAHARTLFVVTLPLLVYLLLKTRSFKLRISALTFLFATLLLVTHHYIYFAVPIILSFMLLFILDNLNRSGFTERIIKNIKINENQINFILLAGFIVMLTIPFFTRTFMEMDPQMDRGGGGRYEWIFIMLQGYTRYFGVSLILVLGAFIYLIFKGKKSFEEYFILLAAISVTQFLYIITYMKWFIIPIFSLFACVSLLNVVNVPKEKNKIANMFVIVFLLISIAFTGYFQFLDDLNETDYEKRYLEERVYTGAIWSKENIEKDKNMFSDAHVSSRFPSISKVPSLTGIGAPDLAYGFLNPDMLEVKQVYPFTSVNFYFKDPYKAINHTGTDWGFYQLRNGRCDINDIGGRGYYIVTQYNLSYFAEDTEFYNLFSQSVQLSKNCLYDNGKIRIWYL